MTGYCKTCGDTLCIGHEVEIDYKSKYLELRQLAQAYLDAEFNGCELDYVRAKDALMEALKDEYIGA